MDAWAAATGVGVAMWGGLINYLPQLSISAKDLKEDHQFIVRTSMIHRGKALERLLGEHRDRELFAQESEEHSIYTRTVQSLDALTRASAQASRICCLCDWLRMVLYLAIVSALATVLIGFAAGVEVGVIVLLLIAVFVVETAAGLIMSLSAQRLRRLASSDLFVVGQK